MREKKFIVIENKGIIQLRFGYPFYHRDLLYKNEKCLGGGQWDIDFDKKEIKLFGKSDDFGQVDPKILQSAINNFGTNHDLWMLENFIDMIYDKEVDISEFKINQ